MLVYHVHFTCAPDYMARRLPFRPAHLKQLAALREHSRVVAGGPEPDGTAANIFYRVADLGELTALLADNEFNRAGLFAGHAARLFTDFLEPLELPPLDAGLATTIAEGVPSDPAAARAGIARLQRDRRAAFGGFFGDGAALVVLRASEPDRALAWLADTGGWDIDRVRARRWSQTL
jgi:uncharacterized protein YciI